MGLSKHDEIAKKIAKKKELNITRDRVRMLKPQGVSLR